VKTRWGVLALWVLGCGGKTETSFCPATDTASEALTIKCREEIPILHDPETGDPYVACRLYEVFDVGSPECACDAPGYTLPTKVPSSVYEEMVWSNQECTPPCCPEKCVCELLQHSGEKLAQCLNEPYSFLPTGWCYVNVEKGVGVEGYGQTRACGRGLRIETHRKFEGYLTCQDSSR
jgi:hypothetical protein